MTHLEALKDLLEPLCVYDFTPKSFQQAQLQSSGKALDDCQEELSEIGREMNLVTAQGYGLARICSLLTRSPAAESTTRMGQALAALLRIGDGSFTREAIADNLSGCGVDVRVAETAIPGRVQLSFPDVPGIPEEFEKLHAIIQEIIPCHIEIDYQFWYITWQQLEEKLQSWEELETKHMNWKQLESYVK